MCNCGGVSPAQQTALNSRRQGGPVYQVLTRHGTPTGHYYTDEVTAGGYAERIGGTYVPVAA